MANILNFPQKKEEKKTVIIEEELVKKIKDEKAYYLEASRGRRRVWVDCWKMYCSWIDTTKNPFLANLFIPKTHEAVELLASFLAGPNQTITAEAEGKEDTQKAIIVKKWMEYQWRKVLKARSKLITWIKQAILFGNGIMKVGWNEEKKEPFMEVVNLPSVFFDYFYRDIQDSPSVIHLVKKSIKDVKEDKKYNATRNLVISTNALLEMEEERDFASYDETVLSSTSDDETILLERWTKEKCITIAPTSVGWKKIREFDNPYKDADGKPFMPFVKVRMKVNPLPNRAYDIGAIEPTIKIQKAFNDMMNEIFDNVSLINNAGWLKREGVALFPKAPIRRPGGITTVRCPPGIPLSDALKADEVPDIKPSAIKMLEILDKEFQEASMVVNLLKGIPGAKFATEAALGHQNVLTLLDIVDQNIKEAMGELGQMILAINLAHVKEIPSLKVLENDKEEVWIDVKPEEIKGKYDIKISADRTTLVPRAVKQKQLIDFASVVLKDASTLARYPDLPVKIYKRWLENAGEGDIEYFFEESKTPETPTMIPPMTIGEVPRKPATKEGLTEEAILKKAISPMVTRPEGNV